ncbi:MAG: alpha-L-rhamnosidase N-terminal domain-containing protein [Opitutaceae bacterium]|nr:alpha-L-rhamnosidase N-terminal domain-containing protein [Opitutaceae bacterium]
MKTKTSPFGSAQWIWPEDHRWDLHNSYALFRRVFTLGRSPQRAPLHITADQSYQLYINGAFVCRGPARGFQSHWPYDEVDVARWLVPGRNVIAVRAHNPGLSNFQYRSESYAGLLVWAQWGRLRLATDTMWRCVPQPGIRRDTVQNSHQLFSQEHYDARAGLADWTHLDCDDRDWLTPVLWPQGRLPWTSLEARDIPMMFEVAERPGRIIGINTGDCAPGWREARNLYTLRQSEDHTHQPDGLHAAEFSSPAAGENRFRSHLIDVGRPVVGSFSLAVGNARGGETIDIVYVEGVECDTLKPMLRYPDGSRVTFSTRLVCKAGRTEHRFYHPFGFRYAVMTVRDHRAELHLSLCLHRTGYPVERAGGFTSSEKLLEQIWETCAWSQQNCMLDAYVDTPWREQAQWWGDARVQAWNTFHLSGDARLFARGIRQIGAQTTTDGVTYGHAPTMAHNCVLPDFTLIWIITLWDYYWQTGDLALFRSQRATIENAFAYFEQHTGRHGLVEYDDRYWLFLDWTTLFKEGAPSVYNLWLLIAIEKTAALYRLTRDFKAAARCLRWAARLRTALTKLVDRRGLMRDGIDWQGRIVKGTSPHAQALALIAGLAPKSDKVMERFLTDYLRDQSGHQSHPSAYWITYVYTLLAERGHGSAVLAHIRPRWAPMIAYGSTFETFGAEHAAFMSSRSHAWSAHPLFHLMQIIGGVRQTAPAWKHVSFAPIFDGEHGGAIFPTPQGLIRSAWHRINSAIEIELDLPKGVTAEVRLPGLKPARVTGSKRWTLPG